MKIPSNGPRGSITRDDYTMVGGGDGMMNVPDREDVRWLYNASQNGAIQRVDQRTGTSRSIRPAPPSGRPRLAADSRRRVSGAGRAAPRPENT